MKHLITKIDKGSIADELGIKAGAHLISVNGEDVLDVIDYEQLIAEENITLCIEDENGELTEAEIEKDTYEPLGFTFENGLMSPIRSCKNHCLFCFIDQMPRGVRDSLHVKDDDWRLSLIMGNYVTLTNTDDAEFQRIIRRHVSPLYISVHSTDPDTRIAMMRNPTAGRIMERLRALYDAGIYFNAQIVLCPELNNGDKLKRTLEDLYSFQPFAQSVAVVPVGLTKHREKLYPLRNLTVSEMREALATIEAVQEKSKTETGYAFVYASDEMYISAGLPLPPYESYDDFSQIENGVGLLRKFEDEFIYALDDMKPLKHKVKLDGATGASAYDFLNTLFDRLKVKGVEITLHKITNEYFGEKVTVAGLVTATDLIKQLGGKLYSDTLIIPDSMLREREDVFLDGTKLNELSTKLNAVVVPLCANDGECFLRELTNKILER